MNVPKVTYSFNRNPLKRKYIGDISILKRRHHGQNDNNESEVSSSSKLYEPQDRTPPLMTMLVPNNGWQGSLASNLPKHLTQLMIPRGAELLYEEITLVKRKRALLPRRESTCKDELCKKNVLSDRKKSV